MMRISDLPFRHQLTLAIVATSAVVLILASTLLVVYERQTYRDTLVTEAAGIGQIVGSSSAAALMFDDDAAAADVLNGLRAERRVTGAALFSAQGELIATLARQGRADSLLVRTPRPRGYQFTGSALVISQNIDMDGERVGFLQIVVDASEMQARAADFSFLVLIGLLLSILIAAGLSAVVQRGLSAPMLSLVQAARRVSADKDYSVRAPEVRGRELGTLTRAFNDMLDQIEERNAELQAAHKDLELKVDELAREILERQDAQKALKEREEQLRQSQKMEAVGMLAGGVAHDFNNILTAIKGFGELALVRMEPDCRCEKYLREIIKSGDRAAALTRQLLAFSRKQVLAPKVLDINTLIVNLETMLRRGIGEDIKLICNLESDVGHITADPGQIEQIFLNLAVNARDAMPGGGTLVIESRNVGLSSAWATKRSEIQPGNYVLLAVSDSGSGMTAEVKARIFEPFFTTKGRGKGTGLGLSTVYGIVKQSGGHVEVYSEIDQGTTFKIYFPRCDQKAESHPEGPLRNSSVGGSETILLVEDEDQIRHVAVEILQARGYEVLDASNGPDALKLVHGRQAPVHLLLTDVIMPGMSGPELAAQVAKTSQGTKILYMSGYTDGAIAHNGVLDPDTPFLSKPFSMDQLVERVRATLDGVKLAA
jgi:signal transduction histidine kinase/ActR/RegA family two-component response regulator